MFWSIYASPAANKMKWLEDRAAAETSLNNNAKREKKQSTNVEAYWLTHSPWKSLNSFQVEKWNSVGHKPGWCKERHLESILCRDPWEIKEWLKVPSFSWSWENCIQINGLFLFRNSWQLCAYSGGIKIWEHLKFFWYPVEKKSYLSKCSHFPCILPPLLLFSPNFLLKIRFVILLHFHFLCPQVLLLLHCNCFLYEALWTFVMCMKCYAAKS